MKKIVLIAGIAICMLAACNNQSNDDVAIKQLREEAIAIHDEIMPQISVFDRTSLKVDSLLANLSQLKDTHAGLDTAQTRAELTTLKSKLENATDSMMEWMNGFDLDPQHNTTAEVKAYYQHEVDKVRELKQVFDEVSKESADMLAPFQ